MMKIKSWLTDAMFDVAGCGLLALGLSCFSAPNDIAPGGVSGLSVMINHLSGMPISALTMLLNIPLLILAWFFLGREFTIKTVISVLILTLELELAARFVPVYTGNVLLAALYGGVLSGAGAALVFMRSSTTGGTDIASRLIQIKFPAMPVGRLILCVDGLVLLAAAIVFRGIENALYGLIAIYTSSTVIDRLLYGLDTGKLMMIMTTKPDEISRAVIERLKRSCTLLDGKGSFSKRLQPVMLCVVRKSQYFDLKRIVHSADPAAFMIALEAGEIIGEGFKDIAQSTKIQ